MNDETPMPNILILGPSLDLVVEPEPPAPPPVGRVGVAFREPPTEPGGLVHLAVLPPESESDARPVNVYVFFVSPIESVPPIEARAPEWFFVQGQPTAVAAITRDTTWFDIAVPAVRPGMHFVQTVLEYAR
jgi:hypothetical protein